MADKIRRTRAAQELQTTQDSRSPASARWLSSFLPPARIVPITPAIEPTNFQTSVFLVTGVRALLSRFIRLAVPHCSLEQANQRSSVSRHECLSTYSNVT